MTKETVIMTKTIWSTQPNLFTIWPFAEKVCQTLV